MMMIGIDVSKRKFDVVLLEGEKVRRKVFVYDEDSAQALSSWLSGRGIALVDCHVCMEATSTYYERLATGLHAMGATVSVVNPLQIKHFGQSLMVRQKTDSSDALVIAQYCRDQRPPAWRPPAPEVRELQSLVARLESLIGMRTQELNRQHEAQAVAWESIARMLALLEAEIQRVEQLIADHIDHHPGLRTQQQRLCSIPGVGPRLSTYFLAWLPFDRMAGARQAAAFVGVTPRHHESGSSVHGKARMAKLGHRRLRSMLFMPALSAMRHNEAIRRFVTRLQAAGKPRMVIVGAVMRKLVHLMFGVLQSGKHYDPHRALART
jgi:transposase